jgi:hypothetical protein
MIPILLNRLTPAGLPGGRAGPFSVTGVTENLVRFGPSTVPGIDVAVGGARSAARRAARGRRRGQADHDVPARGVCLVLSGILAHWNHRRTALARRIFLRRRKSVLCARKSYVMKKAFMIWSENKTVAGHVLRAGGGLRRRLPGAERRVGVCG